MGWLSRSPRKSSKFSGLPWASLGKEWRFRCSIGTASGTSLRRLI